MRAQTRTGRKEPGKTGKALDKAGGPLEEEPGIWTTTTLGACSPFTKK